MLHPQGALLLYDITSRVSFVNVTGWMESVGQVGQTMCAEVKR